jgi:topoisomerase-4 subunit A
LITDQWQKLFFLNVRWIKKEINFEEFIAVKGIKAQGNQLTTDKIKQVNLLASLPFEEPKEPVVEEVEVVEEEVISTSENKNIPDEENTTSDDGQITLF